MEEKRRKTEEEEWRPGSPQQVLSGLPQGRCSSSSLCLIKPSWFGFSMLS